MGQYDTLDGCLPELIDAVDQLEQRAADAGISLQVNDYGGFRDDALTTIILQDRQNDYNAALAAGAIPPTETIYQFRDVLPYGQSYHNYGAAADLSPVAWPAGQTYEGAVQTVGALAATVGLDWPLPSSDPSHFQLQVSLAQAQAMYADYLSSVGAAPASSAILWVVAALVGAALWFSRGARASRRERGGV